MENLKFSGERILNSALVSLFMAYPDFTEIAYGGPSRGFVGLSSSGTIQDIDGPIIEACLVRIVRFSPN